jgi:Flp pilus assembly protein TadG
MTALLSRTRNFPSAADGVAATEFAIIVPFMLLLLVGGVELGDGMAINVKVSATAHSVADMVTQNTVSSNQLSVTVSEVSSDASGNLTLQWSKSYNGSSFGAGRTSMAANGIYAALSRPASLNGTVGNTNNANNQNDQVSFIVSEVSYAYTPNLGYTISGTVNLGDIYWLFPRCSTDSPANSSGPAYYDVKFSTSTTTCTCTQHLRQKTC